MIMAARRQEEQFGSDILDRLLYRIKTEQIVGEKIKISRCR